MVFGKKKTTFKKTVPASDVYKSLKDLKAEEERLELEEALKEETEDVDEDMDSLKEKIRLLKAEKEALQEPEMPEPPKIEPPKKQKVQPREVTVVVKELPVMAYRRDKAKDGTIINYLTVEEALTKVLNEEE